MAGLDVQSIHNDANEAGYVYANFGGGMIMGVSHSYANAWNPSKFWKFTAANNPRVIESDIDDIELPTLEWSQDGKRFLRWRSRGQRYFVQQFDSPVVSFDIAERGLTSHTGIRTDSIGSFIAQDGILKAPSNWGLTPVLGQRRAAPLTKVLKGGSSKEAGLYVLGAGEWEDPETQRRYLKVIGTVLGPQQTSPQSPSDLRMKIFNPDGSLFSDTLLATDGVNYVSYWMFCFNPAGTEAIGSGTSGTSHPFVSCPGLLTPTFSVRPNSVIPNAPPAPAPGTLSQVAPGSNLSGTPGIGTWSRTRFGHEIQDPPVITRVLQSVDYDENGNLHALWVTTSAGGTDWQNAGTETFVDVQGPPDREGQISFTSRSGGGTITTSGNLTRTTKLLYDTTEIVKNEYTFDYLCVSTSHLDTETHRIYNGEGIGIGSETTSSSSWSLEDTCEGDVTAIHRLLDCDMRHGAVLYAVADAMPFSGEGGGSVSVVNAPLPGLPPDYARTWHQDGCNMKAYLFLKGVTYDLGTIAAKGSASEWSERQTERSTVVTTRSETGPLFNGDELWPSIVAEYLALANGPAKTFYGRMAYDWRKKFLAFTVLAPKKASNFFADGSGTWTLDEAGVLRNVTATTGLLSGLSYGTVRANLGG